MNPLVFGAIAGVSSIVLARSFDIAREQSLGRRLTLITFAACLIALAVMCLLTALGFIPDDWSACRLTWPGSLFFGYHLYMGNEGPSNGFFYPPFGAWFYLPAAALGILLHSAIVALVIGWLMSIGCIFAPIALLLWLLNRERSLSGLTIVISLGMSACLVFGTPQLRYVATMVHVDSPAILFMALSMILILPIGLRDHGVELPRMLLAGCLLALGVFSKQSVWPILPGLILATVLFHNVKSIVFLILGALLTGVLLLGVLLSIENWAEAYRMIWKWPVRQIAITPVGTILQQFTLSNLPILGVWLTLWMCGGTSRRLHNTAVQQAVMILVLLALWMTPFAVMTRMRIGADWNHLAIPSYLALLSIVLLIPRAMEMLLSSHSISAIVASLLILGILGGMVIPYLSSNCGWYLWIQNSHEQAMKWEKGKAALSQRIYFPWQALSTLLEERKLYHLDDCLRYEESAGWSRRYDTLDRYFPKSPFQVAIRPFGAPSYLVEKLGLGITKSIPELPGWSIYQKN